MNIALISLLERILITLQLPHFMHSHAQSVFCSIVLVVFSVVWVTPGLYLKGLCLPLLFFLKYCYIAYGQNISVSKTWLFMSQLSSMFRSCRMSVFHFLIHGYPIIVLYHLCSKASITFKSLYFIL